MNRKTQHVATKWRCDTAFAVVKLYHPTSDDGEDGGRDVGPAVVLRLDVNSWGDEAA